MKKDIRIKEYAELKKIEMSKRIQKANYNYCYKYQSFECEWYKEIIENIMNNSIYFTRLEQFESEDKDECRLKKEYFDESHQELIDDINKSIDLNKTLVFCSSYNNANNYLINKYCKNNGIIIKYNLKNIVNYLKNKENIVYYDSVKYVDEKSKYISNLLEEDKNKIVNELRRNIIKKDKTYNEKAIFSTIESEVKLFSSLNFLIKNKKDFRIENEYRIVLPFYAKQIMPFQNEKIIDKIKIVVKEFDKYKKQINELNDICKDLKIELRVKRLP